MDVTVLNSELQRIVSDVCEVSRYIWEGGWSPATGGNLTVDVTEEVGESLLPGAGSALIDLPIAVPALVDRCLLVTVTGARFRDVPRDPAKALMLVKLTQEGTSYQVLWGGNDGVGQPTMEFIPHLKVQASLRLRDVPSRVVLHTHPRHIIAMTHLPEYRDPDFDRVLQTSQSTARVFLGEGVGMTQYMPMGSEQLADRTAQLLYGRRAVIWERHGCVAVGRDVFEAFDITDLLEKAAEIFLLCVSAGYEPRRMTPDELTRLGK